MGTYWDDETNEEKKVDFIGDTLLLGTSKTAFIPVAKNTFEAIWSGTKINFEGNQFTYTPFSGKPQVFKKFTEEDLTEELALEYEGAYYSPEIHTSYAIYHREGNMYAFHIRHGELALKQKFKDVLEGDYPLLNLKFKREDGKITGVWISDGRVRNLWFEKTE